MQIQALMCYHCLVTRQEGPSAVNRNRCNHFCANAEYDLWTFVKGLYRDHPLAMPDFTD